MKIVYMGDSITDAGKYLANGSHIEIGQGYAMITAAKLGAKYPNTFTFVNSGISGNRVVDIYARIKSDLWNHNPDVLSLLIGINDVWHEIKENNGVDAKRFEAVYRMYITDTLNRFPNIKIIAMEPFILKGCATEDDWETFYNEARQRAAIVKKVAEEYDLSFIPLQEVFDKACELAPAIYWADDGVHPTPAGHQLIADAWLEAFEKNILK